MFLWTGSKPADGGSGRISIYQEVLDQEGRGWGASRLSMVFSTIFFFVLGITVLRSYFDSVRLILQKIWYLDPK